MFNGIFLRSWPQSAAGYVRAVTMMIDLWVMGSYKADAYYMHTIAGKTYECITYHIVSIPHVSETEPYPRNIAVYPIKHAPDFFTLFYFHGLFGFMGCI